MEHKLFIVPIGPAYGMGNDWLHYVGPFPSRELAELWSLEADDRHWTCDKPVELCIPGVHDHIFMVQNDNASERPHEANDSGHGDGQDIDGAVADVERTDSNNADGIDPIQLGC